MAHFSVSPSPFGLDFGTLDFGLGLDNYLAIAENAVQVLSADIVPPARACTAFECKGSFIL